MRPESAAVSEATDPIEIAWTTLVDDWESDDRHKAFVALAASLQRLPDAARHYRESLAQTDRERRAQQGIDAVLRVAMLTLTPPKRSEHEITTGARRWLAPMAVGMALLVLTLLAAHALHQPRLASPWTLLAEMLVVMLVPWSRLSSRDE